MTRRSNREGYGRKIARFVQEDFLILTGTIVKSVTMFRLTCQNEVSSFCRAIFE